MAISTVVIDYVGPGIYALAAPAAGKVVSLIHISVTNLGGVGFQFQDSDATQLTGPIMLSDLQQYVTAFGSTSVPLCATDSGKGLNLRILDGGRLTGFAVIDVT
jgi:hypothetical protein